MNIIKKSSEILYTKGKNDECYTLPYGVELIIKYIPKDAVVWCPFDKANSEFVQQIVANGNKVICSHIDNGQDFYSFEPDEHWDVIVSNPPFTGKKKIFERALDLDKPFALICSATWFNDAAPVQIFLERNREMQILMFDYRMRFLNNGVIDNKINFKSVYLCCDFLPRQIILEHLDVPKTQKKVA